MSLTINGNALVKNIKSGYAFGGHKKLTVEEAVTDELLERVRSIAYKDAEKPDTGQPRSEMLAFIKECRNMVAPDRDALLAKAKSQLAEDTKKVNAEHHPQTFLEYVLKAEGKFEDKKTGISGSYQANISKRGSVYLRVFDDNGELVVSCGRNGVRSYPTKAEDKIAKIVEAEYDKVFFKRRNELCPQSGLLDVTA